MNTPQKRRLSAVAIAVSICLAGCSGMSTRDRNTAVGAAVGGAAGSIFTGGSTSGTIGGAIVGGVIGHQSGRH